MLCSAAEECYPAAEARQIAEIVVERCGGVGRNQLIVEPNAPLEIEDLERITTELRNWRPVQYIVGCADFADMALEVEEGVLIPRPETEELVEWIASESLPESTILDVCTGSGCIALALARYIDKSSVTGIDLSPSALAIARRNGAKYAPDVVFLEADALADFASTMPESKFDIIVSNPPYIPLGDKARMRPNVTEYEPDMALYVPDDDALLFYRSIARNARRMLNEGGKLYFEIYEEYAEQMCDMLRNEGYTRLRLREDFRAKQRMICAEM